MRTAFKDKYQKDLDLTASADQVFSADFFRIGGAGVAEAARQASAQIGSDQSSSAAGQGAAAAGGQGTAGQSSSAAGAAQPSPSAGGAGAADAAGGAAQTASSSSGPITTVTIPSSHGMQDVRLNLVKEGSSWKIDVPESIDAQQLNQRLQQQLQMAADHKDR